MNKAFFLLGVFVFCSASAEDCKDKKAPAFTQDLKDAHELCWKHSNNFTNSGTLVYDVNGIYSSVPSETPKYSRYEKGFEKCEAIDASYDAAKTADEKSHLNALLKDHPEWLE